MKHTTLFEPQLSWPNLDLRTAYGNMFVTNAYVKPYALLTKPKESLTTWWTYFQPNTKQVKVNLERCSDGSAPAALASLLFDPPEPQITWNTQCVATWLVYLFILSHTWIFFLLTFSSLILSSLTLPISAIHLSILSDVWLLNFLRPKYLLSSWDAIETDEKCWDLPR